MATYMHKPKCRSCGVGVQYFEQVCPSCSVGHDPDVWESDRDESYYDSIMEREQLAAVWGD